VNFEIPERNPDNGGDRVYIAYSGKSFKVEGTKDITIT
jgi:hypothetical protein